MKLSFGVCFISLASSMLGVAVSPNVLPLLAGSPLRFEPAPDGGAIRFLARGARFRFEFTPREAIFHAAGKDLRLRFEGAPARAPMEADERLLSETNVFLGNDPSKWQSGVPNYGRLRVRGVYSGIDLIYYGNAGQLEYDLIVKPGADPRRIRLRLEGSRARLDRDGSLIAELIQKRPVAYQIAADGKRVPVESRYRMNSDGSYGFTLGRYDPSRELVIDPVLTLAQWIFGGEQDIAYAIGHDSSGLIYVAGETYSTGLTQSSTGFQTANGGGSDIFLTIINPSAASASQIVYTTFLGGSGNETFGAMQVGPQGDVYLTGATASTNFPTVNPAQSALGATSATNAFVAWIGTSRKLTYSSYVGGSGVDTGHAIAVDSKGKMWVTGATTSNNFPKINPFQTVYGGQLDMFIAGIDPSQAGAATLIYSTYLGGTGTDIGRGITVAPDGTLWMVGGSSSFDISVAGLCYQCTYQGGGGDAYIAHINPALGASGLIYATFFGGSNLEEARNVLLDPTGQVIVSGYTLSSANFPITPNALQPQFGGDTDVFVSVFDPSIVSSSTAQYPTAQLVYSTYFGGNGADVAFDLKQDANGLLYLSGFTLSPNLPASAQALQANYDGSWDAFALQLALPSQGAANGAINYFTYLGSDGLQIAYGIDFDTKGDIYLAGFTSGAIFDALGGPGKGTGSGNVDAFVLGFNPAPPSNSTQ